MGAQGDRNSSERLKVAVLIEAAHVREGIRTVRALRRALPDAEIRYSPQAGRAMLDYLLRTPVDGAGLPHPALLDCSVIPGCHMAVVPSREPSLSPALIDALAAGIPSVLLDGPEVEKRLRTSACLVDPSEGMPGLVAAVRRLAGDPEERAALARRGRVEARRLARQRGVPYLDGVAQPPSSPELAGGAGGSARVLPEHLSLSLFQDGACLATLRKGGGVRLEPLLRQFPAGCARVIHEQPVSAVSPHWPVLQFEEIGPAAVSPCADLSTRRFPAQSYLVVCEGGLDTLLALLPTLQALQEQQYYVGLACEGAYVPLLQGHPGIDAVVDVAQPWPEASALLFANPEWVAAHLQSDPEGLLLHVRRPELHLPGKLQAWAQARCPARFAVLEAPGNSPERTLLRRVCDRLQRHLPVVLLGAEPWEKPPEGTLDWSGSLTPAQQAAVLHRAVAAVVWERSTALLGWSQGTPLVTLGSAEVYPQPLREWEPCAVLGSPTPGGAAQEAAVIDPGRVVDIALELAERFRPARPPRKILGLPEGWKLHLCRGEALETVTGLGERPLAEALPTRPGGGALDLLLSGAPPQAVRHDWRRVHVDGTDYTAFLAPDLPDHWQDPAPGACVYQLEQEPGDKTLHLLCPSGIGDFLWIWTKFWAVARSRQVKFWFAEGEQQRAGGYAELVGAQAGYLPGLRTDWVWERDGEPALPPGGGWVTLQANRHLEAGRPLSSWYPELPYAAPQPHLPERPDAGLPYAYAFVGRRNYMQGNLSPSIWAQILRHVEARMPVKLVGAGVDGEFIRDVLRCHGGDEPEVILDRPLVEVLATARDARLVLGLAGGPTIAALCLGRPSLLAYPRWLHRMPGTWEPPGTRWDWCFVDELLQQVCAGALDRLLC